MQLAIFKTSAMMTARVVPPREGGYDLSLIISGAKATGERSYDRDNRTIMALTYFDICKLLVGIGENFPEATKGDPRSRTISLIHKLTRSGVDTTSVFRLGPSTDEKHAGKYIASVSRDKEGISVMLDKYELSALRRFLDNTVDKMLRYDPPQRGSSNTTGNSELVPPDLDGDIGEDDGDDTKF